MIIAETSRLILRTWKESDFSPMYKMNQDIEVMKFFPALVDEDDTKIFIKKVNLQQKTKGYSLFAVERKDS
jgi:[ribosomal protein S5]-alanine N-acetyltransferase